MIHCQRTWKRIELAALAWAADLNRSIGMPFRSDQLTDVKLHILAIASESLVAS